jgi:hypothetical protein
MSTLLTTSTLLATTTRPGTTGRVCNDGEGEPGPLQSRPAGAGAPTVTLSFSPRVSGDVLTVIADALADARKTFGESGALTVRVYCDLEQYVADSRRPPDDVRDELSAGLVAQVYRGDVWIYGPNYQPLPPNERRRVVYHEYFHAVQRHLSQNRSSQRPPTPVWLVEGSARYFEYMVEPQDASTFHRVGVRRFAALPALPDLEQAGGGIGTGGSGEAYTVGAVASDYLVNTYGRDALQHDFWAALSHTDWRSAFTEVFGTTVDDFYSAFEAYRQTLRP